MISDFALDVLLYQSGYREQIMTIVLNEANRIYNLFKERNPGFQGKVHLTGHSLGSAILFDLLCRQKEREENTQRKIFGIWPSSSSKTAPEKNPSDLSFDFDVADFYCLGSPVGLFQMLKGRYVSSLDDSLRFPSQICHRTGIGRPTDFPNQNNLRAWLAALKGVAKSVGS